MRRHFLSAIFGIVLVLHIHPAIPAGQEPAVKPVNLDKVNTEADEDDPFLTPDGLALYYASNGNTAGTFDILKAQRRSLAMPWPAGKRLMLNARDADARSPFLWHSTVYFASNKVPEELKDKKNFDLFQM